MKTFTFYSYKGGVGRSLAVANVARHLAESGFRIMILDFDLEAPGMHYKLNLDHPGEPLQARQGVVDYIFAYFNVSQRMEPIRDYVLTAKTFDNGGEILLMPAGDVPSARYWERLRTIDWSALFYGEGAKGIPFFLSFKERIKEEIKPDFLLIDSRTGITEIGSLTTVLLADAVICLMVYNRENMEGVRTLIRGLRRSPRPPGLKPVQILPVLTRIPKEAGDREAAIKKQALAFLNEEAEELTDTLELGELIVLHSEPLLQIDESLHIGNGGLRPDQELLRKDYQHLFNRLFPEVPDPLAPARQTKSDADKWENYHRRAVEADPDNAVTLVNYAVFLSETKKKLSKAEELYKRAVIADPNHATILCNYALFLHTIRTDYAPAEKFYKRAVTADPNDVHCLGHYATFLHTIRTDYATAEEFYKRALVADPNHAGNLGNYALFLKTIRKDYVAAEEFYKRALAADPNCAPHLGNYANFLNDIRKDYAAAEEFYKRAVAADPNHANNLGNYAGFLFGHKRDAEARDYLHRAFAAQPDDILLLELWFYSYAHLPEKRGEALAAIKRLLCAEVRSPGWELGPNVERAGQENHPEPGLLKALAAVIAAQAPLASLDSFPAWQREEKQCSSSVIALLGADHEE